MLELAALLLWASTNPALPTDRLERGQAIGGSITGAQVRRFSVDPKAGEFAAVRLDQTGGDLILNLFAPDGTLVEIVDQNSAHETETGIIVAPASGRYTVQVAQFERQDRVTAFTITLTRQEPLAATPQGRADQLLEAWYDKNHPGAAVAVLKDGRIA